MWLLAFMHHCFKKNQNSCFPHALHAYPSFILFYDFILFNKDGPLTNGMTRKFSKQRAKAYSTDVLLWVLCRYSNKCRDTWNVKHKVNKAKVVISYHNKIWVQATSGHTPEVQDWLSRARCYTTFATTFAAALLYSLNPRTGSTNIASPVRARSVTPLRSLPIAKIEVHEQV